MPNLYKLTSRCTGTHDALKTSYLAASNMGQAVQFAEEDLYVEEVEPYAIKEITIELICNMEDLQRLTVCSGQEKTPEEER